MFRPIHPHHRSKKFSSYDVFITDILVAHAYSSSSSSSKQKVLFANMTYLLLAYWFLMSIHYHHKTRSPLPNITYLLLAYRLFRPVQQQHYTNKSLPLNMTHLLLTYWSLWAIHYIIIKTKTPSSKLKYLLLTYWLLRHRNQKSLSAFSLLKPSACRWHATQGKKSFP